MNTNCSALSSKQGQVYVNIVCVCVWVSEKISVRLCECGSRYAEMHFALKKKLYIIPNLRPPMVCDIAAIPIGQVICINECPEMIRNVPYIIPSIFLIVWWGWEIESWPKETLLQFYAFPSETLRSLRFSTFLLAILLCTYFFIIQNT